MSIEHVSSSSYASSGFSNRMGWGTRPALLLIDVCKAYFVPSNVSPLSLLDNPAAASAPDSMRRLVFAAREGNVPVIWSRVEYTEPDMADAGLFWNKAKVLDVWKRGDERSLAGLLDGLEPDASDVVVVKKFASAFFGTGLDTKLKALDIDTLVICGVSTSGCVRATTLDSMQHGFRPMVVASACGDRTQEIQNANLFDLDAKYADVVAEEDAVGRLRKGW
ncbi:putative N-carbamoylsarcosine amidase [Aspergillus mulundensis]|uniref:Putative N-carbamoylsarcosine amidase n=1 Tax=Aspergillus mulundensis TaxID=1810919 RepID=A0A3D8QW40_9EURO|nr:putative N-carbamoylsarcosine amidase [Aspergillus mulundensis]RDW65911.1 putative N-carbamoylsarcosine amidase [Aspergillus mulundensis]